MADGDLLSLLLKIEGGEASAAEIHQVESALKNVGVESDQLKVRFQEGFQHVALRGFLADASRSVGIGTELRPIISLLNLGVNELESSFGALGSSLGLAFTGLTALAGVALVVYNHFQKHNQSLDDMAAKQSAALKTTDELKTSLENYAKELGGLPAHLKVLQEATKQLDDIQRQQLEHTKGESLGLIQKQIIQSEEHSAAIRENIRDTEEQLKRQQAQSLATDESRMKLKAYNDQLIDADIKTKTLKDSSTILASEIKAIGQGADGAKAKLDALTEAHKKQREENQKELEKEAKQGMEDSKIANEQEFEFAKKRSDELLAIQKKNLHEYEAEVRKVTSAVAGEFGRAVAQMAIESKSISDVIKSLGTQVAETIIADLIKIRVEALLTQAALSFFGGPVAGAVSGGPVNALGHPVP